MEFKYQPKSALDEEQKEQVKLGGILPNQPSKTPTVDKPITDAILRLYWLAHDGIQELLK